MSAFKKHVQNIMGNIDDMKEQLGDKAYLSITDSLNKLYKMKEHNYYKVSYIDSIMQRTGTNLYKLVPLPCIQVLLLSEEDHEYLVKELKNNDNCLQLEDENPFLSSIYAQLNFNLHHEVVGVMLTQCKKVSDSSVQIEQCVIITGCKKVI